MMNNEYGRYYEKALKYSHHTHEDFFRPIAMNNRDDLGPLVYADYLEENGHDAIAKLIREAHESDNNSTEHSFNYQAPTVLRPFTYAQFRHHIDSPTARYMQIKDTPLDLHISHPVRGQIKIKVFGPSNHDLGEKPAGDFPTPDEADDLHVPSIGWQKYMPVEEAKGFIQSLPHEDNVKEGMKILKGYGYK